jgi:hypothetical protein
MDNQNNQIDNTIRFMIEAQEKAHALVLADKERQLVRLELEIQNLNSALIQSREIIKALEAKLNLENQDNSVKQ